MYDLVTLLFLGCSRPDPTRVLLAGTVGSDAGVEEVVRALGDELTGFGFGVVYAAAEVPAGDDDGARALAEQAGAGSALLVTVKSAALRPGAAEGIALWQASASATLVGAEGVADRTAETELVFESRGPGRVVSAVARRSRARIAAPIVAGLYDGGAPAERLERLRGGLASVAAYDAAVARHAERVEEVRARIDTFAAEGVRCFGDPGRQELHLVGVTAQDDLVVLEESAAPTYTLPLGHEAEPAWSPARVLVIDPDGDAPPREVFRPSSTRHHWAEMADGARWGWSAGGYDKADDDPDDTYIAGIYKFALDGSTPPVFSAGMGAPSLFHSLGPMLSGDGRFLDCQNGKSTCTLDDDAHTTLSAVVPVGGWVEVHGRERVVGSAYHRVRTVSVQAPGEAAKHVDLPDPYALQEVLGVRDDRILLALVSEPQEARGCALVSLEPEGMALGEVVPLPGCLLSPRLTPDGRVVGRSAGPRAKARTEAALLEASNAPTSILLWTPGAPALAPVTPGDQQDLDPHPLRDGKRVAFERQLLSNDEDIEEAEEFGVVCVTALP